METGRQGRVAAPLRVQVVEELRAAIVAAEFQPGERLLEAPLCARFEVSRTVIREALRQLESEGLVTVVANRGPVVAELTVQEASELYELRAALEGLAGALFAERATPAERKALLDAVASARLSNDQGDLRDRLVAKDAFYDALFAGAHNTMIHTTLRGIHARIQMLRGLSMSVPGRHDAAMDELADIADAAARDRDPQRARLACEHHVQAAGSLAIDQLQRHMIDQGDSRTG